MRWESDPHTSNSPILSWELKLCIVSSLQAPIWDPEGLQEQLEGCLLCGVVTGRQRQDIQADGYRKTHCWATFHTLACQANGSPSAPVSPLTSKSSLHPTTSWQLSPWCVAGPTQVARDTENLSDRDTSAVASWDTLSWRCDLGVREHRRPLRKGNI